jgi:hypothetical protein
MSVHSSISKQVGESATYISSLNNDYTRKPTTAAPSAPLAARMGIPVAGATPFDFFVVLVLLVADVIDAVFVAGSEVFSCFTSMAASGVGSRVTSAATRAAMPRAKNAVSFILSVVVVSSEVCRWFGGMKVVGSCWLSVGFSGILPGSYTSSLLPLGMYMLCAST